MAKTKKKKRSRRGLYNKFMQIAEAQNWRCAYCGRDCIHSMHMHGIRNSNLPMATLDHIIPLSKNGTNDIENLVLACADCNNAKSNLLLPVVKELMPALFPKVWEKIQGKQEKPKAITQAKMEAIRRDRLEYRRSICEAQNWRCGGCGVEMTIVKYILDEYIQLPIACIKQYGVAICRDCLILEERMDPFELYEAVKGSSNRMPNAHQTAHNLSLLSSKFKSVLFKGHSKVL